MLNVYEVCTFPSTYMQGGHGGFTQIPYTVPYTPTKNTVQYPTFSEKNTVHSPVPVSCTVHNKINNLPVPVPTVHTQKKNLMGLKKNCDLGKPQNKKKFFS